MKTHSITLNISLVIAAGCLSAGYILGGYGLIMPVFLAMAIFWVIMKKQSVFWSASSLLLIYVGLAVIGVTLDLSICLMVPGCAAALACWDLIHFRQSVDDVLPLETDATLERYHLGSLITAIFTGMLLAFTSSILNLQFPFGVIVFLVLIAMGSLNYGMVYMVKK